MGILEQVIQMKNQGMLEEQIISNLQQQGLSPNEINTALNQAQIKNAVSEFNEFQEQTPSEIGAEYIPQTQEINQEQEYQPEQPQEYYPQPGYESYESTGTNSDMVIEIAEQVFSEKIRTIEKKIEELNEFKTLTEAKIITSIERLNKIENIIDKLQMAILEKIGSYGTNLETIKKEMSMLEGSFGKLVKSSGKSISSKQKNKSKN